MVDSQIAREPVYEPRPGTRSIVDLASLSGKNRQINDRGGGGVYKLARGQDANRPAFGMIRVFLNPWFGEPVVCTLDSRGFRHFRGFRDFRESSTQLLVCSCLSCLRRFRRFRDFRRFRERRPAPKP